MIVLTNNDIPLGQMIQLGWAVPLDQSRMTNFKKYASPLVTDPTWDPGNTYTMAWQSGLHVHRIQHEIHQGGHHL